MGGSKKTTTTEQRNELPAYMRGGSQRAVQMATDRTRRGYEAYGGQRIAGLTENERLGSEMARTQRNVGAEDFRMAGEALGSMGSFTDEGIAEQYMNPYMEQVVQPGLRRRNEAFESERASRKAKRGMQNAFGGRGAMWDNKYEQDFQREQDEYMGQAYGAAYESAAGLYSTEQGRKLQQAGAYADMARSKASVNQQRIYDLMNSGLVERTRDQAELDFKYIEHLEERDWDINNLDTLVRTLATVPHESTQTSTTTEKTKPNAMKMLAGVAMITAGIMTGGTSLAAMGPAMIGAGGSVMGGSE